MRAMRPGPSGVRPHSGQRPPCMPPSRRLSLPLMKLMSYSLSRPWLRLPPRPLLSGPAPFGNSLPRYPPPGLGLGDLLQGPDPPALPAEGLRLLPLVGLPTLKASRRLPIVSCPLVDNFYLHRPTVQSWAMRPFALPAVFAEPTSPRLRLLIRRRVAALPSQPLPRRRTLFTLSSFRSKQDGSPIGTKEQKPRDPPYGYRAPVHRLGIKHWLPLSWPRRSRLPTPRRAAALPRR